MKTERRHELETNELARRLNTWYASVEPYRKPITGALVGVVVLVAVVSIIVRRSSRDEAKAWDAYYQALSDQRTRVDLEKLITVQTEHPGTDAQQWASLAWADAHLQLGTQALFRNKPTASKHLQDAIDAYQMLRQNARREAVRQRATFGLGRAYEARASLTGLSGSLKKAREYYSEDTGPYAQLAALRIEALDRQETRQFYDWFAKAEPAPSVFPGGPGTPGIPPPFELNDEPTADPAEVPDTPPPESGPALEPPAAASDSAAAPDSAETDSAETDSAETDSAETDSAETDSAAPQLAAPEPDAAPSESEAADEPQPDTAQPTEPETAPEATDSDSEAVPTEPESAADGAPTEPTP